MFRSIKIVWQYFKNRKMENYKNVIDSTYFAKNIKILTGYSVITLETDSDNRIVTKFSLLGLMCYVIWLAVYFYSSFISSSEDQTILRSLYNTQLNHYGDAFERIASIAYVIYAMWKIPFDVALNHKYAQEILDIDRAFEKISVPIDHSKSARVTFVNAICQFAVTCVRLLTVWVILTNLETEIPIEGMLRVAFTDAIIMVTTSHYFI